MTGQWMGSCSWVLALFATLLAAAPGVSAAPDMIIDNFDSVQSGTSGTGSEPFLVYSKRFGWLDLTYNQPSGASDIAWWEALSWSWQPMDVSPYNYVLLDVRGLNGGEDFTFEFHCQDILGQSQKPWVRISDYCTIGPDWQTVSIPIEDFRDFQKARATAIALGFRYPTDGPASVALDNIGLSVQPASFFWTHRASSIASDSMEVVFKPHLPAGQPACSEVTLFYSVNGEPTNEAAMILAAPNWAYCISDLDDQDEVSYSFSYSCATSGISATFRKVHHSVIDDLPPSAPGVLSGAAISPARIDLGWTASSDNVGVAGYIVYRNEVEIGRTSTTNYSSTGLNQDRQYDYFVRAFDAFDNWSPPSQTISVRTPMDVTPPTKPLNFTGEATSAATVLVSWDPSCDDVAVKGYWILRDGADYCVSFGTCKEVYGTPGNAHEFAVQAYDEAGNRSPTSEVLHIVMPQDLVPPTAPENLAATPINPARIDLSWLPSEDDGYVAGYEVFVNGSHLETVTRTDYRVGGLSPETTYAFSVRAFDTVGVRSEFSETAVASTPAGAVPQKGSYAAAIPEGLPVVSEARFVTENMAAPFPTHDWWTSIMTVRASGMLSAKPLAFYAKGWQLECAYPQVRAYTDRIEAPFSAALGISGIAETFPTKPGGYSRADGYGDFSARARIGSPFSSFSATMIRGSPYVHVTYTNCAPKLNCPQGYTVVTANTVEAHLVIRVPSQTQTYFAIFAPSGTTWDTSSQVQIIPGFPPEKTFLSVALMPGTAVFNQGEFNTLKTHAYAFVTNTHVELAYNQSAGRVTATYSCETAAMQGDETNTLMGLLPMHWKNSQAELVPHMNYKTHVGDVKIHAGNSWSLDLRFGGIVPQFPKPDAEPWSDVEFAALAAEIEDFNGSIPMTYWYGVELGRVARAVLALDAAGHWDRRDMLVGQLRAGLENLFTYTPGETAHFFAYDSGWGTMVAFSESFNAVSYLNDHHFHSGYFVYAAAVVGMYDRSFVDEYRDMVDRVVRDFNNPSRDMSGPDPLPWLRHFDPWSGHCWATGLPAGEPGDSAERLTSSETPVASAWGVDQESTSEAMNSWAAMFLWGMVSGNREFIDMGAIGYAMEGEAIREYWYDADDNNWPAAYPKTMVSRVFCGKADALTWFDNTPDAAWGIQYTPVGPHMTYMGDFLEARILDYLCFRLTTPPVRDSWKDAHWMYRSFFEPADVLAEYDKNVFLSEGNSHAAVYYIINSLNSLGRIDTTVYSDCPTLVALTKAGTTNYVAFNSSGGAITASVFRVSDDSLIGRFIVRNQRTTHVVTDADADGDGLANGMEMELGTDLFGRDSDGDGQDDWTEILAGVNPVDCASVFQFSMVDLADEPDWRLEWPGNTNRLYKVVAYPTIAELLQQTNGEVLVDNLAGTGWMTRVVAMPQWTSGVLRLSVSMDQ